MIGYINPAELTTSHGTGQSKPDLSTDYNNQYIIDKFNKSDDMLTQDRTDKIINQSVETGAKSAAAGGGLSGMLTSGGLQAGLMGAGPVGWGVMGAGMILSGIEKNKQEKAAREQAAIEAEKQKRNNLIQLAREASQNDFRLT